MVVAPGGPHERTDGKLEPEECHQQSAVSREGVSDAHGRRGPDAEVTYPEPCVSEAMATRHHACPVECS